MEYFNEPIRISLGKLRNFYINVHKVLLPLIVPVGVSEKKTSTYFIKDYKFLKCYIKVIGIYWRFFYKIEANQGTHKKNDCCNWTTYINTTFFIKNVILYKKYFLNVYSYNYYMPSKTFAVALCLTILQKIIYNITCIWIFGSSKMVIAIITQSKCKYWNV